MSISEDEIATRHLNKRNPLRADAALLIERSKRLRARSQKLKFENALLIQDVDAIVVHVNQVIFHLDHPLLTRRTR